MKTTILLILITSAMYSQNTTHTYISYKSDGIQDTLNIYIKPNPNINLEAIEKYKKYCYDDSATTYYLREIDLNTGKIKSTPYVEDKVEHNHKPDFGEFIEWFIKQNSK